MSNDLRIMAALPATPQELKAKLHLSHATVSKWLHQLEGSGRAHVGDKRPGVRRPHHVWHPGPKPGTERHTAAVGFRADPLMGALFR